LLACYHITTYPQLSLIAGTAGICSAGLTAITGHLWTTGFRNGDLKTPLFDDVVPTLEAWKAAGKTLAIFSSGSVQAQLQFFSYVRDGPNTRDIKPLFSAHYDTVNAGPKLEKASYEKICSELGTNVSNVSFLTDNVKGMLGYLPPETLHHTVSPLSLNPTTTPPPSQFVCQSSHHHALTKRHPTYVCCSSCGTCRYIVPLALFFRPHVQVSCTYSGHATFLPPHFL